MSVSSAALCLYVRPTYLASVGLIGFIRIGITYRPTGGVSFVGVLQSMRVAEPFLVNPYASEVWVAIQLGFSVICCCLVTYRPLLPKHAGLSYIRFAYSSLLRRVRSPSQSRAKSEARSNSYNPRGFRQRLSRYDNLSDGEGIVLTEVVTTYDPTKPQLAGVDFPADSINVKKTLNIV